MSQYQPRHRPTPFKFPALSMPLTPPETIQSRSTRRMPKTAADALAPPVDTTESLRAHSAPMADWAAKNPTRRTSSIGYLSSGLHDSAHERPQKTHKSFIIVIPPPSFSQEDGEIANLGLGPRHRLSQGMVVPLCSTMYGQLSIIAREFSFPSTTGICLYMTFNEDGIEMKPRILDEAWPIIWRHVLEPELSHMPRSPISGKVEFDIDFHQARWYSSWISSLQRNYLSQNLYSAPSISHSRTESRITYREEEVNGEQATPSIAAASSSRYMPRKLTLVDRQETSSNVSASTHRSFLSPEKPHQTASILSPIFQESEPQSARSALHSKVETWRATATVKPKLLATTGQTSLEAANIPNTLPIEDMIATTTEEEDGEIHLSDYQWSISSAGPPDYDPVSPALSDDAHSIHLLQRNQGSVCLTPSTQTSFGPNDSAWSPVSSVARLPSPDLGHRMLEDCPPTPSTATSWGAPLEWPASPFIPSRPPSVHLGDRMEYSRPVTPLTATSWGAPSPLPTPTFRRDRPRSVHIAFRDGMSRPVTPDVDIDEFEYYQVSRNALQTPKPWALSWPHFKPDSEAVSRTYDYPYLIIYEAIYPHFDLYPAVPGGRSGTSDTEELAPVSVKLQTGYPVFDLYPAVYPWNLNEIYPTVSSAAEAQTHCATAISVKIPATYPIFDLYPSIYPWNLKEIYPVLPVSVNYDTSGCSSLSVKLPTRYPQFNLYPAVYPWNLQEIYPAVVETRPRDTSMHTLTVKVQPGYPVFDLYPPVYPWNLESIYPSIAAQPVEHCLKSDISVKLPASYPNFELYSPVYPWNLQEIYPAAFKQETAERSLISVRIPRSYPHFDLYLPVYPWNLEGIYPAVVRGPAKIKPQRFEKSGFSVKLPTSYPHFDLYSAVYPWNLEEIYPAVSQASTKGVLAERSGISLRLPALYPKFNLYAAVYPWNLEEIYPAAVSGLVVPPETASRASISVKLSTYYPIFNLYPAVYPGNLDEIYPATVAAKETTSSVDMRQMSVRISSYPHLELYAPVYPWNLDSIYPAMQNAKKNVQEKRAVSVVVPPVYPTFNLYPSVYPFLEIYPTIKPQALAGSRMNRPNPTPASLTIRFHYPHLHLYSSVYPYFDLYPATQPIIAPFRAVVKEEERPKVLPEPLNSKPEPVKAPEPRPEPPVTPATPTTWDQIFRSLTVKRQEQAPVAPAPPTKKASRLTHAELHAIVTMEDPSFAQRISSLPISPSTSTHIKDDDYYAFQLDKNFETPISSPAFHAREITAALSQVQTTNNQTRDFFPSSPTFSDVSVYSRPASQDIYHLVAGFGNEDVEVSA